MFRLSVSLPQFFLLTLGTYQGVLLDTYVIPAGPVGLCPMSDCYYCMFLPTSGVCHVLLTVRTGVEILIGL